MTFEPLPPSDSAFTATSGWTIRRPNARTPIATLVACAACLVVWAILTLGPHASIPERLSWFGAGPPTDLWDGRPWGLVTSAFVHLEPWHVAFNVYWIWRLGSVLEDLVGAARWIAFCVLAALVRVRQGTSVSHRGRARGARARRPTADRVSGHIQVGQRRPGPPQPAECHTCSLTDPQPA